MRSDKELKRLQRKALLTFFQDGLWDIFLGLFVIDWGVGLVIDLAYLSGIWLVALGFLVIGVKHWIIYPRTGYVKLGSGPVKVKLLTSFLVGLVALLGVLMMLLVGYDARPDWVSDYFPLIFSGMMALVIFTAAEWLGVRRFFIHAALVFIAGAVHQWGNIDWAYTFIAAGTIIVVIGAVILAIFLKRNPKHPDQGTTLYA